MAQMLIEEVQGFRKNNSLFMTKSTNAWLMEAVSLPQANKSERHYYDYEQNEFFVIDEGAEELVTEGLSNNNKYNKKDIEKLADKISKIATYSGVIEIPRMTLDARIAIQIDFITSIENFKFFDAFLAAIREQDQTQTFALDHLLSSTKGAYFFVDYWSEFKTQQLLYFINDFEDEHDFNLKAVSIWDHNGLKSEAGDKSNANIKEIKKPWWKL